jgi:secreted trypsin-like serine protease
MNPALFLRSTLTALVLLAIGCGPGFEGGLEPKVDDVQVLGEEIVGGTDTTIAENPWQVSLQSSSGSHFCGGQILDANWVLTAQHCVNSGGTISAPGRVVAGITKLSQSSTGQIRTVTQVTPYPGYVDASKGKDVALLRLSSPLDLSGPNAKAIGMVTAADASAGVTNAGVIARITGWGTTSSGGTSPDNLKTADVTILTNAQAQSSYPQETITSDQLAAAAPGKDTCQGDSGGPLTVLKNGVRVLAGTTSWGYGCADPLYPGMYGRVSSFETWITSTMSAPPPTTLLNQTNLSGSTGSWRHYPISVPSGKTNLTVTMSGGTGDADLYVKFGSQPTLTSYNCRPYKVGNNETCSFTSPSAGTWYVSIQAYSSYSGVSVTATVQ